MKYLKFKNDGEIQPGAIVLLGASTKRNSKNKIGFFGSGNKFALAYLLRNGYNVNLFGGEKEIVITTKEQSLGEDTFNVIYVNDQQTSITTEFGAKWKLWQALREIYSNAVDEGGEGMEMVNSFNPTENETHYYIEMRAELLEWFSNFNSYFCENKEVLFESKFGKILKKHDAKANVYRRGIRVYETEKNSIYDYDLGSIEITEDRIVKYSWQIGEKIWSILYSCNDKEIIRNVLKNVSDSSIFENFICEYAEISSKDISAEFKEVLAEMRLCNSSMGGYLQEEEQLRTTLIPNKIFKSISHFLKDDNLANAFKVGLDGAIYREYKFSAIQLASIAKVVDFLHESKLEHLLEYPIVGGLFERKSIIGYADRKNECIVITDIGVDKGTNMILEIIIEEYIHLKHEANDNTRQFQDACIQEMVKVMKIRNTFIL
jgi:hypothetical protein